MNGRTWAARRRGSAYLLIVGVALAASAICVGALTVVRAQVRAVDASNDAVEARFYAMAAVDMGRYITIKDDTWRSDYGNGMWINNQVFGKGTIKLKAVNPNGSMTHSASDPVILTGYGTKGAARQIVQATLTATVTPLNCLQTVVTSGGTISLSTSTVWNFPGQTASAAQNFSALLSTVNGNAEAGSLCTGLTFKGTQTNLAAVRSLPDSTAFDYYTNNNNSTALPASQLPVSGTSYQINSKLLSPMTNTITSNGATNVNGIYVIDCGGHVITIGNSRIVGTLVLLNTASGSGVTGNVSWTPATTGMPCLMVKGPFNFGFTAATLAESTVNFNPPGTPDANGATNTVAQSSDTYVGGIQGLVYVSGAVTISAKPNIGMLMAGGNVTGNSSSTCTFTYDPTYNTNPPPGFYTAKVNLQAGSWAQASE